MLEDLLKEERQTPLGKDTSKLSWQWNLLLIAVEYTLARLPKTSNPVISFSNLDFKGIDQNLHDLVVISVVVGNYIIWKVLVD